MNSHRCRFRWIASLQHACKRELWCNNKICTRFHGRYEPKQKARFLQELYNDTSKDKFPGMVACGFGVFGLCPHYNNASCPYRHFSHILPLSAEQQAELDSALEGVDGLKRCSPLPVVIAKPAAGSYGPKFDSTPIGTVSCAAFDVRAGGSGSGSSASPATARISQPSTMAPWSKQIPRTATIASIPNGSATAAPISAITAATSATVGPTASGSSSAITATAELKTSLAPVVSKASAALHAIVAALLHQTNRRAHVTALGAQLRHHGIASWRNDYSPQLGSLWEFISRSPKVFTIDSVTKTVSLSAAAGAVASKSLSSQSPVTDRKQ
jgi:predicted membrane protein